MSTNPSTPITRASNVWSALLSAALTDEMLALINKSPTLRAQLNQLSDEISASNSNVKAIQLKPSSEIGSSQYAADTNTLTIAAHDLTAYGSFSAAARFVGILAHEMGHRIDDANLDYAGTIYGKDGKDEEFASIGVHSEGVAAANTYIVRKEILQTLENNGGPEIYFPGAEYAVTTNPYGLIAVLTTINNAIPTWSASEQLAVLSEVGANYLANVLTGGGNPPGTQTNWQYFLNSSRAIRGLPAAPAPQANSVELVDINNDGIIEYVQYRDASNICRREDYTTNAAGEHITTKTTYVAGFGSAAKDHTTTVTRTDGTKQVAFDTDGDNTIEMRNEYTASNALDNQRLYADNGAYSYLEHDQNGDYDWKIWNATWDAQGGYDYTQITYDSGAVNHVDYNQANTNASGDWYTWNTGYDTQGRYDYTQIRYNSNAIVHYDKDQDNNAWDYWISAWDGQGRYDYTQVIQDSGAKSHYENDQANEGDWNTWTTNWDAQGRIDSVYVAYDDGGHAFTDYDTSFRYDWQSWSRGGDYGWHDYANGQSIAYDVWDHYDNSTQNLHYWNNKDQNANSTDYGWEFFTNGQQNRYSWDISKNYSMGGTQGVLHAWKSDGSNYGWYYQSNGGKVMYESVNQGQLTTEHAMASPLNGSNPSALYYRAIPTYVNSGLYDISS
jgi:hypothetical protein